MIPTSTRTVSTSAATPASTSETPRTGSSVSGAARAGRTALVRPAWARAARDASLVVCDAAVLLACGAGAYWVWARGVHSQPASQYLALLWLLPLFLAAYAQAGLYPGFGIGAVETLRRFTVRTSLVFLAVAAAVFAFKVPHLYSRATFLLAWGASLVLLPLGRFLFLAVARRWSWWHEPAVVVLDHDADESMDVIAGLERALTLGYRPEGILLADADPGGPIPGSNSTPGSVGCDLPGMVAGLPVLGGLDAAEDLVDAGVRVAFAFDRRNDTGPGLHGGRSDRFLDRLQRRFRHVILVTDFGGAPVERIEVRNLGTAVGVEFENQLLGRRNRVLKRAVDLVVASCTLVLVAPVVALAGLVTALVDPGPVFYRQTREGRDGCRIEIWKLRTMYADAEERLTAHLEANRAARAEWEARFKLTDDPRVIPYVGTFLRRWSIDELPQLWNVVKGEMSLVGPRPLPDYHLEAFDPEFLELRRRVRPGITGLWQVMVRGNGTNDDQQGLDSYYIRNWSPWLDLYVMARTGVAVLRGTGAY